jgi:8-oxo-dGTP pyrophosphatase MutT (NUDIX family)
MSLAPWRKLGSRVVCDCRVFSVRADRFEVPSTREQHEFFVVDCPDWVNVIALTSSGEVVLVRQHRFGIDRPSLEIPGGMIDPGESPLEAAARELLEETGYRGRELSVLGTIHPNPALQPNTAHTILALDCVRVAAPRPDAHEDLELLVVPLAEIDRLLASGEISHALVATAFLHWKLRGCPGARQG